MVGMTTYDLFVTAARGTEPWAEREAFEAGACKTSIVPGGVQVRGGLEVAYRLCLWSRVGQRVLLPLSAFRVTSPDALYQAVYSVPWQEHLCPDTPFEVECTASAKSPITHTHFAALKTKDAIADYFRHRCGRRPSVAREGPRVTVHLYLGAHTGTISIDLSGEPLYKRGYRREAAVAPLKETLAAALLYAADWPQRAAEGEPLVDPFCGSGTIVIEAALMALDRAPGLTRRHFGFLAWKGHDAALWQALLAEAYKRARASAPRPIRIHGSDVSHEALALARRAARWAGVNPALNLVRGDARAVEPPTGPGVVVTNPPYGKRVSSAGLDELYASLGDLLRRRFLGWTAYVFTGNLDAARRIGLRADRRMILWNGPIEARLLRFPIAATPVRGTGPSWRRRSRPRGATEKSRCNE
ncbi:MAG: RNA methyltransferase [Candidatus Binatia bacterium]|nr:MAG: RNA methyltransferase [Candidatus Binatia bacterium]